MDALVTAISLISSILTVIDFVHNKKTKKYLIIPIIILGIPLLMGIQKYNYNNDIFYAKQDIVSQLMTRVPKSFEQLRLQLDNVDKITLQDALIQLEKEGTIVSEKIKATSESGDVYIIEVYNSRNFGIRP